MFGQLNKILDRDFFVGHFVPALALMAASMGLLHAFGAAPLWLRIDQADPLKDTTFLALVTWGIGLVLLALDRSIIRVLEGYCPFTPDGEWPPGLKRHLTALQRRRFLRLRRRLGAIERASRQGSSNAERYPGEYTRLSVRASTLFPSEQRLVMPTAFGNAVRAFEDYPRAMYGFEAITGWSRLHGVVPAAHREEMGNLRASMTLWVNLWLLSGVTAVEYLILAGRAGALPLVQSWPGRLAWVLPACVAAALVAYRMACDAAVQWGEWVKAAFDLFLPDLCRQLGYDRPTTPAQERELWEHLSAAISFRDPAELAKLAPFRTRPEKAPPAPAVAEPAAASSDDGRG